MKKLRRWLTARVSERAVACAPWLSDTAIDSAEKVLAWAGPWAPRINTIVADNMRSAGLYSAKAHREYFRLVAAQLSTWMHIFRHARTDPALLPGQIRPELAQRVEARVCVDASMARLKEQAGRGQGAILLTMHGAEFPLWLLAIDRETPITVLGRHSKDARRQRMKELWRRSTGLDLLAEPSYGRAGDRLAKMTRALDKGRVVVVAADLVRKRDQGKPVRFFDREIHLASGAAVLALLTGAPLMRLDAQRADGRTCLSFHGPFTGQVDPWDPEVREAAIIERLQWWADALEAFVRRDTPLWYFWGDKRWSHVFRGDARYVRFLEEQDRRRRDVAAHIPRPTS